MASITRQILICLVIVFSIGGLHAILTASPAPARCESDKDCLKGQAKCIRRECHCTNKYAVGDGKTKCETQTRNCSSNEQCHRLYGMCFEGMCHCVGLYVGDGTFCREVKPCPSNQKCPDSRAICYMDPLSPVKAICRCDIREGFKRSKDGTRCIECSSDKDCKQTYATCYEGICQCKDELIRDGKTCKPAPLHKCKDDKDCDSRAKCEEEKCICQGNTTGNGKYCRDSLPCSPDNQCGIGGKCLVDPLFPKKAKCRCDNGYRNAKDGRCTECLSNKDCNSNYSTCDHGTCKCKDELIKEGKTCKHAPLHLCDEEHKCHEKAKCHLGKCYCQGNATGNGIFCRDSLACPEELKCGNHSVCVVDPLFPDKPDCKCDLNYKKSADGKQCEEVTECLKKGLVCNNGTICGQDSNGSYNCVCQKGFKMALAQENTTCQDIDECKHTNTCLANSTCHNLEGSYKCTCNHGYKMNATKHCDPSGPSKSKQGRSRQYHSNLRGTGVSTSSCTVGHVIILLLGLLWYQTLACWLV